MNRWQSGRQDVVALVRKGLEGVTTKAEAARIMGDQPHLVPVRKGGPWARNGGDWERWVNDEFMARNVGYHVSGGVVRIKRGTPVAGTKANASLEDTEFRAPKDWTGDLPEGTRLATDLVVGQRVRSKENHTVSGTIHELFGSVGGVRVQSHDQKSVWVGNVAELEGF